MVPIIGRFGPFLIYSYQVVWGVGICAGILLAYLLAPSPKQPKRWLDPLLVGMSAGIVAGRVAFVAVHWDYFFAEKREIWQLWLGGVDLYTVWIVGLWGVWVSYQWWGGGWQESAGTFALLLPLLFAIGWTACYFEACGYGIQTGLHPLSANLPDNYGVYEVRAQTQLLGIGISLLILLLAIWGRKKKIHPVAHFWWVMALLSAMQLLLSGWRGDLVYEQADVGINAGILLLSSIQLLRGRSKR